MKEVQENFIFDSPKIDPPKVESAKVAAAESDQTKVRVIETYKMNNRDRKFRRKVKEDRGSICEKCCKKQPLESLQVHHILETRIYREYAREPLNVIVVCCKCHDEITSAERNCPSEAMVFYSSLSADIRLRHLRFLEEIKEAPPILISALRSGDQMYWNDRAVDDLTR